MTNEWAGQGVRSPLSTASNGNGKENVKATKNKKQNGKKESDKDMLDISGNFLDDQDFDNKAKLEMLRKHFENKFALLQTEFRAKVDEIKEGNNSKIEMMKEMLGTKDELISSLSVRIGKLEADIESLKKSQNFVTKETTEVKNTLEKAFSNNGRKFKELEDKTQDLEDRSRRNNLVIFGVPEETNTTTTEDCDKLICDLLRKHKVIDPEEAHAGLLERAHILGKKNPEQSKPRPIIVLCGSFKDKQYILYNSNKLKGTPYFIAEDYSKATLAIRRELVQKGNHAKERCPTVQSFQVKYKRLVLKYLNPNTNKTFTWSYGIQDTEGNPKWFEPPPPNKSFRFVNANGYQKY